MNDAARYLAACHAMQSGVATMMHHDDAHEPKHLRVGVNVALSDLGALVKLLCDKGVISLDEYQKVIADHMEAEKKNYEKRCSEAVGVKVTLA